MFRDYVDTTSSHNARNQFTFDVSLDLDWLIIIDYVDSTSNGPGSVFWPWNQTKPFIYNKNQTKLFTENLEQNQTGLS